MLFGNKYIYLCQYISTHPPSILDVSSSPWTNLAEVQDTKQVNILQMLGRTLMNTGFIAI